jgi:hypothetical protein
MGDRMESMASSNADELNESGMGTPRSPAIASISVPSLDITLDSTDPFESALIEMVKINRKKRQDYALDGDPFSNFHMTSSLMSMPGFGPLESVLFNVAQKFARLTALRTNGRMDQPANEGVEDTYKDMAVYATILYAMHLSFKR